MNFQYLKFIKDTLIGVAIVAVICAIANQFQQPAYPTKALNLKLVSTHTLAGDEVTWLCKVDHKNWSKIKSTEKVLISAQPPKA